MSIIPIAKFAPDIADINANASADILNVLPSKLSYIAAPKFKKYTLPLPGKVFGSISIKDANDETYIFVGLEDKIVSLSNTGYDWINVSREGKGYNAGELSPWCFAVFGNYVIAVNQNNNPQVLELRKDSKFKDLSGDPPKAGIVRVWGDFVCLMNIVDKPNRVHWSGLNDITHWKPGEKSSDYQDFPEGEIVQGSNDATNPIILMRSAIYAAQFLPGSDVIFSFKKIHSKVGAKSSLSIACHGEMTFYIDEGGFFQIDGSGQIFAIGKNILDNTIFSHVKTKNLNNMQATMDPYNSRVYFAVDYHDVGYFDRIFVYDFILQLWSQIEVKIINLMPLYLRGYSLEDLDNISKNIDLLPSSLDSKAWQKGAPLLGAIDNNNILGFFSGANMNVLLSSGELCDENGYIQTIKSIRGIIDTQIYTISIGTRFRRDTQEPIYWRNPVYPSHNTGYVIKKARGRYFTFHMQIEAGKIWKHATAFEVEFKFAGIR